jgi:hypothetical protein
MLYVSTALVDDAAVEIATLIVVIFAKPAEASLNDKRVEPDESVLPVWLRVYTTVSGAPAVPLFLAYAAVAPKAPIDEPYTDEALVADTTSVS